MAVQLGIDVYLQEARPIFYDLTVQVKPTSEKPMAMIIKITRWPRPGARQGPKRTSGREEGNPTGGGREHRTPHP